MAEYIEREAEQNESICRRCFHSYVCEQFNEHRDGNNSKCHFCYDHFVPAADVVEVRRGELRVEINTECFGDAKLAEERGWYRKFFYCPNCGSIIRTESWDSRYMFGSGTVLKTNDNPNYCPKCGTKFEWEGEVNG